MKAFLLACVFCLCAPLAAQEKPTPTKPPVPAAAPAPRDKARPKPRVRIDTVYGPVVLELEPELAPKTVANFLLYVSEGFYTDTLFHRVVSGFMIQGGGLGADMIEKPNHGPILNEAAETFKAGLRNTRGALSMARTDKPQSANSQFFINTFDNPRLDHRDTTDGGYGYCVFGRVVSGMEAVDKIEKVRTVWRRGLQNVPEYPVRIKSAQRLPDEP